VTFSDPSRSTNRSGENWREAATARFLPNDPDDLDAYNAVYRWAFDHFPRWVWCDEAGIVLPVRKCPPAGRRYIVQGSKRELGHLACHTRPREVDRSLIANAAHVIAFDLPNPDDRKHVADLCGIPPAQFDHAMRSLGPREFVWWNVGARRLISCPALRS